MSATPTQGPRRRPGRPRITKGPRLSTSPVHASHCSCGCNIEDSLKAFFGCLSCWDKDQERPKAPGASVAGQGQSTVSISTLAPGPDSKACCLSAGPWLRSRSWLQDPNPGSSFLPRAPWDQAWLESRTQLRPRTAEEEPSLLSPARIHPECLQLGSAPSTQETEKPRPHLPAHPKLGSERGQRSQQGGSVCSRAKGI